MLKLIHLPCSVFGSSFCTSLIMSQRAAHLLKKLGNVKTQNVILLLGDTRLAIMGDTIHLNCELQSNKKGGA